MKDSDSPGRSSPSSSSSLFPRLYSYFPHIKPGFGTRDVKAATTKCARSDELFRGLGTSSVFIDELSMFPVVELLRSKIQHRRWDVVSLT